MTERKRFGDGVRQTCWYIRVDPNQPGPKKMNASDSEKNDLRRKIQDWAIRQGSVARDPQNWKALREAAVRYCRELGTIIPGAR